MPAPSLSYVIATSATLIILGGCGGPPATRHVRSASTPPSTSTSAEAPTAAAAAPTAPAQGPPGEPDPPKPTSPSASPAPAPNPPAPHPFASKSDRELEALLDEDPAKLGSLSLGRTNAGALFGGVQMPKGARWIIVNPRQTWGTQETIDALTRCIDRVNEQFPNTAPIHIGDISEQNGGRIPPHLSHQSGRDVDVGYYYKTKQSWYTHAHEGNLDLPRTWAFVRAMITESDVQRIFIDRRIQKLLRAHAESIGEDAKWLDRVFGGPTANERALILHEKGHASHIHVRFYNPVAQESGRRLYKLLVAKQKIAPPTYYIHHKVRRRDTLGKLARKYSTTIKAIKRANRIRGTLIITGRKYKIPRRGGVAAAPSRVTIPPRRLPPPSAPASAAAGAAALPTGSQATQ